MKETPAATLLGLAHGGDSLAWTELVGRYGRLVWSVVRGYRLGDETSADVTQTVWLKLAENCDRIRDPERLACWLATVARNEAVKAYRQEGRFKPQEDTEDTVDMAAAPIDESLLDDEQLAEVAAAIANLSPDYQRLIRLITVDPPLSYAEIAQILGRPVGSIGPTRQRCLDALRRQLGRTREVES